MPIIWLLFGFFLVLLLFGDIRAQQIISLTPEKAAGFEFNKMPIWKTIEPPDNRIRMLWILHDYVPFVNAGSEICAHTLNKYWMKHPYKYDIWVASPGYPKRTYEGVRCFDLYDKTILFEVLKNTSILHSHSYIYRKQLLFICNKTNIPFVEWVHTDNYVNSVGPVWCDNRVQGKHWTVFNSKSLRQSRPDIPDTECKIYKPPVNYRGYSIDKSQYKPKYVTLSNVNENKGGRLLIQLAKACPEMEFMGILGGYRKQITYSGLPNLKYIQHTTQIKSIYEQTWVQIMPSETETWGRTAVEAMSSGIPVVVSPTPGLQECCGTAALYCDRNDLDSWVSTLRKLKDDREFYNSRSAAALLRARALDPLPELDDLDKWITSLAKPVSTLHLTIFEKNMLFR